MRRQRFQLIIETDVLNWCVCVFRCGRDEWNDEPSHTPPFASSHPQPITTRNLHLIPPPPHHHHQKQQGPPRVLHRLLHLPRRFVPDHDFALHPRGQVSCAGAFFYFYVTMRTSRRVCVRGEGGIVSSECHTHTYTHINPTNTQRQHPTKIKTKTKTARTNDHTHPKPKPKPKKSSLKKWIEGSFLPSIRYITPKNKLNSTNASSTRPS